MKYSKLVTVQNSNAINHHKCLTFLKSQLKTILKTIKD